ncbi:hypothetical protein EVAR_87451_1 [Eumeta japonica]|uniref:Uncharacterized protein n=1 Tax=Eumeta variegata TaxID=151549 RepID=A0A4C1W044_EUMVA|nr:hypothetical protein EVAR_87451_1 [Eumeta japonica]
MGNLKGRGVAAWYGMTKREWGDDEGSRVMEDSGACSKISDRENVCMGLQAGYAQLICIYQSHAPGVGDEGKWTTETLNNSLTAETNSENCYFTIVFCVNIVSHQSNPLISCRSQVGLSIALP